MSNTNDVNNIVEDQNELVAVRKEKLRVLIENGKNPFEQTKFERTATSTKIKDKFDFYNGKTVNICGRMMSKRIMGKASFAHILDVDGQIQMYLKGEEMGEAYEEFKKLDIGDIIGATGTVFLTQKGEISVHVTSYVLLSKSLLPLPEKWHGLQDSDLRYRQRCVDLIVNPDVKTVFVNRSKIIKAIRSILDSNDFIEVETPILNTIAGGATARPFVTHHNTLDIQMYLRIATELHLKRLVVGGIEKVYEIGRIFRNEGMSTRHNPEFTTLELYSAYEDLSDMMTLTEKMFGAIRKEIRTSAVINFGQHQINLKTPFVRISMIDAVLKYTGIDFGINGDLDNIIAQVAKAGLNLDKDISWGNALYSAFEHFVEPHLIQPTFVFDYPVEISPLAKKKINDNRLTSRFELFVAGIEFGNAYTELNDPIDQAERFVAQEALRQKGDDEAQPFDFDFLAAMEYGMPPMGGLGIGIDRLVMLFTDSASIRDVLLFPTMKPIKKN